MNMPVIAIIRSIVNEIHYHEGQKVNINMSQ